MCSSDLGQVVACDSKREYLCSIVGFMPPFHLCSSDRNVWGCAGATGEKTAVLYLRISILLTL